MVPSFCVDIHLCSPYAIDRYVTETKRLYSILDKDLADREYLTGSDYGVVDIKAYCWARAVYRVGVDLKDYPNVLRWKEKVEARPAVQAGLAVPAAPSA